MNINNLHTGFIAAPALIENEEIIPAIINKNANGFATSDIIRLNFYRNIK